MKRLKHILITFFHVILSNGEKTETYFNNVLHKFDPILIAHYNRFNVYSKVTITLYLNVSTAIIITVCAFTLNHNNNYSLIDTNV